MRIKKIKKSKFYYISLIFKGVFFIFMFYLVLLILLFN